MGFIDGFLDKMKLNGNYDEDEDYDGYDDDEEEEYTIVGTNEADPFSNKISNESPIAKAVMGKKVNDKVTVESPNGSFDIEIVKVA